MVGMLSARDHVSKCKKHWEVPTPQENCFQRYRKVKCWSNWTELAVSCMSVCVICLDKVYCLLSDWWTCFMIITSCFLLWLGSRINNASDYLAVGAERGSIGCSFWFGGLSAPAKRFWSSNFCLVYKIAFKWHPAVSRHIWYMMIVRMLYKLYQIYNVKQVIHPRCPWYDVIFDIP
jgi:hypothetical protein